MARRRGRKDRGRSERPRFGKGPRPAWSGTLSFGLVTVPVDLFPASRDVRTSLRMLAPDGTPLSRRYACSADGRELERDELARGYEVDDGEYVLLDDDELEAAEPRKSRDIQLQQFVDADALDPFLFERAYVLTPAGESAKPYRLLAAVMQAEAKAGIATFVLRGKEHLAAIHARAGVLWAETLRFADELRAPEDVGLEDEGEATPRKLVRAWRAAIDAVAADELDRAALRDEHRERLDARVAEKHAAGEDVVDAPDDAVPAAGGADEEDEDLGPTPDLLDVIRRRLAGGRSGRERAAEGRGRDESASRRRGSRPGNTGGRRSDDLDRLSKDELYARAQDAEVAGRSRMTKAELVRALRGR